MDGQLPSFEHKLNRANQHRKVIAEILATCAYGTCKIVPEEDPEHKLAFMRVRLPQPPYELSLLIGDFLFNARASLDYLVHELVVNNSPNVPTKRSMFPICSSPDSFAEQIKGHRLDGVPEKAKAVIEGLQPYPGRNNPLRRMADLHEIDKHRTLNLITAVASDTHVEWNRGANTLISMFIGGEELRDGSVLGDIGIPLDSPEFPGIRERLSNVEVQGSAALFVAFQDATAEELEPLRIETVLEEIAEFIKHQVFPALQQFMRP